MKTYLTVFFYFLSTANPIFLNATNQNLSQVYIDPSNRGGDILTLSSYFLNSNILKTNTSDIAVQTTYNGLLNNIQAIQGSTYNTILLFKYGSISSPKYKAVMVEQIIEMVYSHDKLAGTASFASNYPDSVQPIFNLDPLKRSLDVIDIFSILNQKNLGYWTPTSKISLKTTLSGSYNPSITDGLIENVQSISVDDSSKGTLILVTYLKNARTYWIVVMPEQILEIQFTR
jgi:hypothetical protein